jgi:hypothetical protein
MKIIFKKETSVVYSIICIATAMINYHMYHNLFYAILSFILTPITWIYWLITQQINLTIIQDTFSFFLK